MKTSIASVLDKKGRDVWTISPKATVGEAIETMTARRCQGLVVTVDDQVVGIVTERDCGRRVVLAGKDPKKVAVHEVMTSPVVCISPKHTVGDCLDIITSKRATHLPVLEDGKLGGVIAIGDVLRSIVDTQSATIGHLEGYISGKYPG